MNVSSINNLYKSLCLFVDHQVLQKGVSYTNKTGSFYKMTDPALPNHSIYASPFKSWNWDYSISGSNVPSGVYINNVWCPRGQSGLKIDYLNGRILLSGGSSYNNLNVTGSYSVKDWNVIPTTKSDEELIFETKYELNPSYNRTLSGLDSRAVTVPAIFLSNTNFTNEPFEFGGMMETCMNIHCLIISDSMDELDALGSLLVDEKFSSFPVVTNEYIPLNAYGDFKTGLGNYNYLNLVNQFPNNLAFIEDVDFYRLSSKDFSDRYQDLKAGFVDIYVKYYRQPNKSIF